MKLKTRIRSRLMRIMISPTRRRLAHFRGAVRRRLSGSKPVIHYFHQVDDPYSHLAVQKLALLKAHYTRVRFCHHLVSGPDKAYQGDHDRYYPWTLRDARSIARFYNTELPETVDRILPANILAAQNILARVTGEDTSHNSFSAEAVRLGNSLWQGHPIIGGDHAGDGATKGEAACNRGDQLQAKLGHYQGAMFYFEGEWYWGLDRLYHLEHRLHAMGLAPDTGAASPSPLMPQAEPSLCVPRPAAESATGSNAADITLEYFPSLRSPYTAISYDRTMNLVQRSGVTLVIKPVMPMMMRGVPAPTAKQQYIITDANREAEAAGVPFGPMVDPFGEPVKRAFSLYPYLRSINKDAAYLGDYLRAAWSQAVDITTDKGLASVVEGVGVPWSDAKDHLGDSTWEGELDANVNEMLDAGLWGVPSFRVTGGNISEPFSCWGQDRLWRVETEISRRAVR